LRPSALAETVEQLAELVEQDAAVHPNEAREDWTNADRMIPGC
jgi:hypothetical protein